MNEYVELPELDVRRDGLAHRLWLAGVDGELVAEAHRLESVNAQIVVTAKAAAQVLGDFAAGRS